MPRDNKCLVICLLLAEIALYNVFFSCSTNSLFAIPSNQEFVFFKPKQQDRFTFLLELLNDTFEIGTENPNDFREFLNQHISLAQTEGNFKAIFVCHLSYVIGDHVLLYMQVLRITLEDIQDQVFLW